MPLAGGLRKGRGVAREVAREDDLEDDLDIGKYRLPRGYALLLFDSYIWPSVAQIVFADCVC